MSRPTNYSNLMQATPVGGGDFAWWPNGKGQCPAHERVRIDFVQMRERQGS